MPKSSLTQLLCFMLYISCHNGLAPSHPSLIKKIHHRLACRCIWWEHCFNRQSLFPNDSNLCQLDIQLAKNMMIVTWGPWRHISSKNCAVLFLSVAQSESHGDWFYYLYINYILQTGMSAGNISPAERSEQTYELPTYYGCDDNIIYIINDNLYLIQFFLSISWKKIHWSFPY